MLAFLNKRKKMITLFLVLTMLLVLTQRTVTRQGITVAEEALLTVVAPVQGVFQRFTSSVEGLRTSIKGYQFLAAENRRLQDELAATLALEARLTELRHENNRLRQMLNFEARSEHELIAAEVIARDSSSWFQTISINKGSLHGVEQNLAVVTSEGLIGSILAVSPVSSQVLLLTDNRRAVSAMVQRSREPGMVGVVEADADLPGYLRMINLPRDANIQPGDTIISSGLGGIYPQGLVLGYVLEMVEEELGLLRFALLRPAANFNRLEEVFVVVPSAVPAQGGEGVF
ncbi:MAG: rod shape-determining protein MreC [Dethiobacter sp.]|jgi:rod shape-determining protein MreC|nr:rod shape-determining protein MreC [Dethiobacter sp.]MBS3901177.1 rod shape-determining protein MreC [Dethiobacter sp.]MBS3989131.1 rod shape-determining protein MreC [Dethiobacter sp.]